MLDVSDLNRFVTLTKFKMETCRSVLAAVQEGDWMSSVDLKDAYLQIPMHPGSCKFLRFVFSGVCYQWRVLPFGLCTAPQVFTRVMNQVARWLHLKNIRVCLYLDDWLIMSYNRSHAVACTASVLKLASELGILINVQKSHLVPSQVVIYLGMIIDSERFWVAPRVERVQNAGLILRRFQSEASLPARQWMVLLGHMASLGMFVPGGRLRSRAAQFWLKARWARSEDPGTLVPVGDCVKLDVLWWLSQGRLSAGRSLRVPSPELYLYKGASLSGWGASMSGLEAAGIWSLAEQTLHINILEMRAVGHALRAFRGRVLSRNVAVLMDNTSALAYLRNQGGRTSFSLVEEARVVLVLAETLGTTLLPAFVPGDLNVVADRLSRQGQTLSKEWTLNSEVCQLLWDLWGVPHVDLFATRDNFRLPRYVSPVRDSEAWAMDAMLTSWGGMLSCAYPPFALMGQVLAKLRVSRGARLILIAPFWPRQAWFPHLFHLSLALPRRLPLLQDLLSQPSAPDGFRGLEALAPTAWLLGSKSLERRAFRERLPVELLGMFDPQRDGCTSLGGDCSRLGVRRAMSLLTLPL